jgi:predicted ester cyclase
MLSFPDPKRVVEAFFDAYNAHDVELMASYYSEWGDFVAPGGLTMRGRDLASRYNAGWLAAFPDFRVTPHRYTNAGNIVAVEASMEGTHLGALRVASLDVAPTGRRISGQFTVIYEVQEGEIISGHLYFDRARLLAQLGQMPQISV